MWTVFRFSSDECHNVGNRPVGEASNLLRTLISCRKLGITPTEAAANNRAVPVGISLQHSLKSRSKLYSANQGSPVPETNVESHSAAVLGNRTNLPSAEEMPSAFTLAMKSMEKAARANMTVVAVSKQDSNRRKQSCPSKADASAIRRSPVSPYVHGETYLPDFTGNSPWCNISAVKTGRVSHVSIFVSVSANSITFLFQKEIKTTAASPFVFLIIILYYMCVCVLIPIYIPV